MRAGAGGRPRRTMATKTARTGRTGNTEKGGMKRTRVGASDKSRAVLRYSVNIGASEQQVWNALTDWEHQDDWMLGTRVRGTTNGGQGVGGGVEAWTGLGPLGFLDTMVITAWEPPNRCEVDHVGKLIRGAGAFYVGATKDGGSVLTWVEDVIVPGGALGMLGWRVIRPAVRYGVRRSLMRLSASLSKAAATK